MFVNYFGDLIYVLRYLCVHVFYRDLTPTYRKRLRAGGVVMVSVRSTWSESCSDGRGEGRVRGPREA